MWFAGSLKIHLVASQPPPAQPAALPPGPSKPPWPAPSGSSLPPPIMPPPPGHSVPLGYEEIFISLQRPRGCTNELTLLKALGDPARLAALRFLRLHERTVSEVVAHLAMEQSAVSHHLKVLREAGLVESRYEGAHVVYRLAHPRLAKLLADVAATAKALDGVCRCAECGGTLLRPYPKGAFPAPRGKHGRGYP
jgi:DNA-binding transcriptional ArsR family regulator